MTTNSKAPTHIAYVTRESSNGKKYSDRIGVAWGAQDRRRNNRSAQRQPRQRFQYRKCERAKSGAAYCDRRSTRSPKSTIRSPIAAPSTSPPEAAASTSVAKRCHVGLARRSSGIWRIGSRTSARVASTMTSGMISGCDLNTAGETALDGCNLRARILGRLK